MLTEYEKDIVKEFEENFLWISDGNSLMRDGETRVDDWLSSTLVAHRKSVLEEVKENLEVARQKGLQKLAEKMVESPLGHETLWELRMDSYNESANDAKASLILQEGNTN